MPKAEVQIIVAEDAEFIEAVKAGVQSIDDGRSVPYEQVRDWLLSWGTDNEKPVPKSI
ncbi:hypothetical protein [Asticcacaulis sp. YBE204]|uniref:hypothetical protein n=1 Tax=Asticcacaulis sp. YBE204 TaxID=1282363 RepID=UPI0003C3E33F|nr:hypothetical protein [Asticcacaulis sp. YBE204]ESQ79797.1 hypothetical protein AEYBE204_08100 [Asticcacaulis sp. YBE204]